MFAKQIMAPYCIYTIRHKKELDKVFAGKRADSFTENKIWREGYKIFQNAQKQNMVVPLLLGAADQESGIIYVALIDSIEISTDKKTSIIYSQLTSINNPRPKKSLVLKKAKRPLSDRFIRNYALCYTPDNIRDWE